tara:strand:- start:3038 stop:3820 length:783 start_codon:yes stop_codon:yes gene_type:complete
MAKPDDYYWFDPRAYSGYIAGEEGLFPDAWTGGTPTKEAVTNPVTNTYDRLASTGSDILDYSQYLIPGYGPLKGAYDAYNYFTGDDAEQTAPGGGSGDPFFGGFDVDKYTPSPMAQERNATRRQGAGMNYFRKNLDPSNTEQVKALQSFLGIEADGKFGPQTEKAWRLAVEQDQAGANRDPGQTFMGFDRDPDYGKPKGDAIKYDKNPEMLNQRMADSKTKIGGLLKKGWHDLDKGLFKGKLPGGYDPESAELTASEYYK